MLVETGGRPSDTNVPPPFASGLLSCRPPSETVRFYPTYGGALVCANTAGEHGAARHGLSFSYTYRGAGDEEAQTAHAIEADEEYCRRVAGEGMVNRREYFQDRSRDARHFGEDR